MSEPAPIRIEVFSDTICPWCFIGKRRLERALRERPELSVDIKWLAFQLNPDMPDGGMDRRSYLEAKFGGVHQARRIYEPIERAGAAEDIDFRFDAIPRTPSTLRSHRLIHYAEEWPAGQDGVVEGLFESYFSRGEDIGDVEVLTRCAERGGVEGEATRAYLQGDEGGDAVRAQDRRARQLGIAGVPFFLVDRRYRLSGAQPPEMFHRLFDALAGATA
jgi:predicted DsbA family dithiol-disulfide isomerase